MLLIILGLAILALGVFFIMTQSGGKPASGDDGAKSAGQET